MAVLASSGGGRGPASVGFGDQPHSSPGRPGGMAFTGVPDMGPGAGLVDLGTGAYTDLGPAANTAGSLRVSPDGSRVAFLSRLGGSWHIRIADTRTGVTRRLRDEPGKPRTPDWSPDGSRLVFVDDTESGGDLFVVSAYGGEPTNITRSPAKESTPRWSPDGCQIAYLARGDAGSELWVMDVGSGRRTNLTCQRVPVYDIPCWSPDGSRIAFVVAREANSSICLIGSEGGDIQCLAQSAKGPCDGPTWSPDGTRLAFSSDDGTGTRDIAVVSARGGATRRLTAGEGNTPADVDAAPVRPLLETGHASYSPDDVCPSWSPDGSEIAFQSDRGGSRRIWAVHVGTGAVRPVPGIPERASRPVWFERSEL